MSHQISPKTLMPLVGLYRANCSEFLQRVVKKEPKKGQPLIDILEINRLQRQLLFHSYVWDQRLISATGLGSAQFKELTGHVTKCKEKPTSVEKLAEMNLPSKALSLTSPDTLTVNVKNTNALKGSLSSPDNQGGYKPDHYIGKLNSDLPESLEGQKPVRRALSEGQFPMVANLSETLDAAWTGEATPTSIRPQENSFALLDSFTLDSSTPLQSPASMLESEIPCANPEDKGQVEVVHAPGSKLSVKVPDRVDDFTSWIGMPFLSFYRSFNKNSSSNSAKLNSFSEYNPVYVSSFQELVHQGGARLLLPVGINDTVVSVYDNEPTSIISYALVSLDYHFQMSDERERIKSGDFYSSLPLCDSASMHPFQTFDEITQDSLRSFGSADSLSFMSGSRSSLADPLLYTNAMPVRVSFTDDGPLGKVKYMVTCYYAKGFEALRRICCPSELDFVRSLCRCKRWGAQGGKSNALFEKSLDDRFIIKQVTKTELESFAKFAPGYFKYLSESIGTGSPTCLAKILGIYQISSKHLKGGKESRIDVLVMENLMFGRKLTRVYDLKGSSRSRYNDCSGTNKVLLDQNLIEAMPTSPIFVGNKAKRLLERAVWNDTSFLASIDVMDYSLLVGVDEEKHELVLGIIDFIRQYTWDKHLETWVKASGILGGPKNSTPTVVSPKQYKKRFRKAMSAYFLMVPDQWFPPTNIPNHSQSDLKEENLQNISP